MLIAEIFLGFYAISFAGGAVLFPIVGWIDPEMGVKMGVEMGVGGSITVAIVYAALAGLSWKGFSVTRSIQKELAAR